MCLFGTTTKRIRHASPDADDPRRQNAGQPPVIRSQLKGAPLSLLSSSFIRPFSFHFDPAVYLVLSRKKY